MSRFGQFVDFVRRHVKDGVLRVQHNMPGGPGRMISSILGWGQQHKPKFGESVFSSMLGGWGWGLFPGSWTSNRVEQAQHYRHWVYKAVRLIMELCTKEQPMIVDVRQKSESDWHQRQMKRWLAGKSNRPADRRFLPWNSFGNDYTRAQAKAMQVMRPHESFEFVAEEDPLKKIMDRPNYWDTGAELDQELIMYLQLMGNGYEWPVPYVNAPGIAERWIMPSHWIWPQRTGYTNRLIDFYECRPWGQSASAVPFRFDADEFIFYRFKSPLSKIDGMSPLQAGAETVDSYEQTQLARFFSIQNGANVGDYVQLDASVDPNEDKIARFLAMWKSRYQGVANFNAPGVLPPGAELIRREGDIELAYMQSADQLRDYVLAQFGILKSVAGFLDEVNRAAFEAALAQLFYLTINPLLSFIDVIRTEKLASRYGKDKRIFHRDMTPADRAMELNEWQAHAKIAPYTGNEFRQWRGMEPMEEGEEVIVPGAMGADPFGNMSDEELRNLAGGGAQQNSADRMGGFGSAFKRFWEPSANGVH